jgi:hypothetical protein
MDGLPLALCGAASHLLDFGSLRYAWHTRPVNGDPARSPASFTLGVIAPHLASEGFLAIVGWDILFLCVLTRDVPARSFRLDF